MNRRAFFAAPLALAVAPVAAMAAVTENVQPHTKLRVWNNLTRDIVLANPNDHLAALQRAAHDHFGGLPCAMHHLRSDGASVKVEFVSLTKADDRDEHASAYQNMRIDGVEHASWVPRYRY